MITSFTPVMPHFYEIFEKAFIKENSRVIYFGEGIDLLEEKGKLNKLSKTDTNEEFIEFNDGRKIRIDRIIAINGIPGPAYEEYDTYATACLDCNFEVH